VYTRPFFIAFAANIALVTGNVMSFRFAEFVKFLGGTEEITGRIVAFGLVLSLVIRLFAGQAMDRWGIRRIWIISAFSFLTGTVWIALSPDLSWPIYIARGVFVVGLATMFACSVAQIQTMAPPHRRTELIGTFGASGFLGMIIGAQLVDLIFKYLPDGRERYLVTFSWIVVMGLVNLSLALWLTHGEAPITGRRTPALGRLLKRYFPTSILLVTLTMGLGFAVTTVFLTRYATSIGLTGTRTFFTAYAVSAFMMRFVTRRWSHTMGRYRMIWWGMLGHVVGQCSLMFIASDWHLIIPAVCCGFGHALLFPCIVSLGADPFPAELKATGTTIVLATVDLGTVLTAPLLGYIIDHGGFFPMLLLTTTATLVAALWYGALKFRAIDQEMLPH
jgi:MFS family permease